MPTTNLFKGIAVVIDDEIGKKDANINNIIKQIEAKKMPCVKYKEIPHDDVINHLEGISFLLLDWMLYQKDHTKYLLKGNTIPATLRQSIIKQNIIFLKKLKETYFVPVFIFTDEVINDVITDLKKAKLYFDDKPNYIFVMNKSELKGRTKLTKIIENWARKSPSIYVLKEWEKEYHKAKNCLFHDFYNLGPSWPSVLWKNYDDDGVNPSSELGEVITRNIHTRMAPFAFDGGILNKRWRGVGVDEVRKVLEGERCISEDKLSPNSISTGDVFKIGDKIMINIRPDCDCIPDRNQPGAPIDEVKLYLLKGSKLTGPNLKKSYVKEYGHFFEQDSQSIIFSITNGKSYDLRFKDLTIDTWANLKDKRIGRLLPPYITRIQQRYALYLQRQGLPRTPPNAVS